MFLALLSFFLPLQPRDVQLCKFIEHFDHAKQSDQTGDDLSGAGDALRSRHVFNVVQVESDFNIDDGGDPPGEVEGGQDEVPFC